MPGEDMAPLGTPCCGRLPTYKVEEDGHGCELRASLPQQKRGGLAVVSSGLIFLKKKKKKKGSQQALSLSMERIKPLFFADLLHSIYFWP